MVTNNLFILSRLNPDSTSEPLKSLPPDQHAAISQCLESTRWLLHDEIASSSRSMLPVTSDVLDTVAKHVKNSIGHAQCLHEEVQLQFVFGTEQTLTLFEQVIVNKFQHSLKSFMVYLPKIIA